MDNQQLTNVQKPTESNDAFNGINTDLRRVLENEQNGFRKVEHLTSTYMKTLF
jgi:hypothetical protein